MTMQWLKLVEDFNTALKVKAMNCLTNISTLICSFFLNKLFFENSIIINFNLITFYFVSFYEFIFLETLHKIFNIFKLIEKIILLMRNDQNSSLF